jgi:DNA phosphorothioation-associated putative methyltransferase
MIGKRVGGELYIHRISVNHLPNEDRELVEASLNSLDASENSWNVLRIANDNIAFLTYSNFEDVPFPPLEKSVRLDLLDGRKSVRDFSRYSNPPILHRKELLLPPDHPRRAEFAKLTNDLDEHGVFYDSHRIGFKKQWEARLSAHGIKMSGHDILELATVEGANVQRHKTALVRYQLSQPVQLLMRYGLLKDESTFFDYGCGRGDDLDTLLGSGLDAAGWDPHYALDNPIRESDVVNIGFVLNVIEDADERQLALKRAWELTGQVLAVAVMSPSSAAIENARPYKDGFLTSRNTFQKYYTQEQLRDFILQTTGADAVPVAAGIFFVFADDLLLQEFQINRYERDTHRSVNLSSRRDKPKPSKSIPKLEQALPILEHLAEEITALGRPLHSSELSPELKSALGSERIAFKKAHHYCIENLCDLDDLASVAAERKDDLILYFAIELFSKHKSYRALPIRLQQDLRAFWGNYANAQIEARQLLFSIGDREAIQKAAEDAADDGLGYLLPDNQFQFHHSILKRLPLILRCYVACGSILFGDIESADIVKIHINTGKLTLQFYENFSDLLPVISRRIKIDMRSQNVRIFDYDDLDRQYLFMKSLFLPEGHEDFEAQSKFDSEVSKLREFDFSGYGPDANLFDRTLTENKIELAGFDFGTEVNAAD